jgi:exonuclease SbcC
MKFKKVEISAFRIYDSPENATFDLTTESGNAADFVSLYAPNGFGKTSFYDAVEWAITKSINRFYIRSKELEKLADFQSEQNDLPLIRNSKSTLDTYVKVYTDLNNDPINSPFKKHGKQLHDINFKKPIVHEFQKVILSQEWISAFLTESNGETRYEKFMEKPELSTINNYYNNLKNIWSAYEDKVDGLEKEITNFKSKIAFIGTENLLDSVNTQISLLIEKYGESDLNLILLSTTQQQIKKFRDIISNKVVTNNREVMLTQILNYTTIAKSGDKNIVGIEAYFSHEKQFTNSDVKLIKIKSLIEKFEKHEKSKNEFTYNQKLRLQFVDQKEETEKVLSHYEEYQRIRDTIDQKINLKVKAEATIPTLEKHAEDLTRMEVTYKNQFNTLIKQTEELNVTKSQLPITKESISKINLNIKGTESQIFNLRAEIEKKEKEVKSINDKSEEFVKLIEEVRLNQYSKLLVREYPELIKLIDELENKNESLSSERAKLKDLNSSIDQQQTLNNTIEEFIRSGLSIVNERQSSNCPLCEQTYESYNLLAKKISNNKALSDVLKRLLSEKSAVNQQISSLSDAIKLSNEILVTFYNAQINNLNTIKQKLFHTLETLKKEHENKVNDLRDLKEKNSDIVVKLNGLTVEEFEKQLDKSITETLKNQSNFNQLLSPIKIEINTLTEQIKGLNDQIILLKKEIENLEANEKYTFVITWYKNNYPDQLFNQKPLIDRNESISKNIVDISNKVVVLGETIKIINGELSSFNKENLLKDKKELEDIKQASEDKINSYKYFLKDKLDIDLSESSDKEVLLKILNDRETHYKSELIKAGNLFQEYLKLEKYSENIAPFLQSENSRLELKKKENEYSFLIATVKPFIEKERADTRLYLDAKVKDFFYEDLINDLYKKIDPHPEFKAVEFKVEIPLKETPLDRSKVTPAFRCKLTPLFRSKLTPAFWM